MTKAWIPDGCDGRHYGSTRELVEMLHEDGALEDDWWDWMSDYGNSECARMVLERTKSTDEIVSLLTEEFLQDMVEAADEDGELKGYEWREESD